MEHTGRRVAVVAALAIAAATMASTAFVVAQDSGTGEVEMTAGEEISVLASAQEAQVRHDVEDRAWLRDAENESAFEDRVDELRAELDSVEERKAEIDERVESGEISERRAAALKAHVEARAVATNRSVDRMTARASERGINTTALNNLRQRASSMTGQEVRRVARNVAAGSSGVGPPEDVGPPEADETRRTGPPSESGSAEGAQTPSDGQNDSGSRGTDGSGDAGGPPADAGPSS